MVVTTFAMDVTMGDLFLRPRFLPGKLITRQTQNIEALAFIGLVEVFERGVLRRKPAF